MEGGNLQRKLMCRMLLPMVFGMVLTAFIAYIPFYFQFPNWIDQITQEMITDKEQTFSTVSQYLSLASAHSIQYPINLVLLSGQMVEKYYNSSLKIKKNFTGSQNYVSAVEFALGKVEPYGVFEGASFETSMWYVSPNLTENNQLNQTSRQNLYKSTVFDFFLRPISSSTVNLETVIDQAYLGYWEEGLMYVNPSRQENYFLEYLANPNCSAAFGHPPYFDIRCRPWLQKTKNGTEGTVLLTDPYIFAQGYLGQTACVGKWLQGEFSSASCLDYSMNLVREQLVTLTEGSQYVYALTVNEIVTLHPDLKLNLSYIPSIQELEFGKDPVSSEINYFNEEVLPIFSEPVNKITRYKQYGNEIIIAISPVLTNLTLDFESSHISSIGIRVEERTMTSAFDSLKEELLTVIYIEGIIVVAVLAGILVLCYFLTRYVTLQIVRPIDNLLEVLERMINGDLDLDIMEHYQLCSLELTRVYDVFNKLKIALRFEQKDYFRGDAQATMNYAHALQLFTDFGNKNGTSLCYENLGNINFRTGRFEEACECYQKALKELKFLTEAFADKIRLKIYLAKAHFANEEYEVALKRLLKVKEAFTKQETTYAVCLVNIAEIMIKQDNDPQEVLDQLDKLTQNFEFEPAVQERLLYVKGLQQASQGHLQTACELFTQSLELSEHHCPETRKICLQELLKILKTHNLPYEQVSQLLEDFEEVPQDFVYLLDSSLSMAGDRIQEAQTQITKTVESTTNSGDKVAFIHFNQFPKIVLNLTPVLGNKEFIKNKITNRIKTARGTAIYESIKLGLKELNAYETTSQTSSLFENSLKSFKRKWIVLLTDGEDTSSKLNFQSLKKLLKKKTNNLVIVGLGIPGKIRPLLEDLCTSTPKGFYLDAPELQDLERAFARVESIIKWDLKLHSNSYFLN